MQAFLLIGDLLSQEEYLSSFKKENNISSYLYSRNEETFKIADVRILQKTLSLKLQSNEARMVVIVSPTLDAQNAILKTLEELPEKTFVFFLSSISDSFLPTILSRVLTINLHKLDIIPHEKLVDVFLQLSDSPIHQNNIFDALEILSPSPTHIDMETFIISLRAALLKCIADGRKSELLLGILKTVVGSYQLSKSNNINKRMALENVL